MTATTFAQNFHSLCCASRKRAHNLFPTSQRRILLTLLSLIAVLWVFGNVNFTEWAINSGNFVRVKPPLHDFLEFEQHTENNLLTFFTSPKFAQSTFHDKTRQTNAILSWLAILPSAEVIIFLDDNDNELPAILSDHARVKSIKCSNKTENGFLYVPNVFVEAANEAKHDFLMYVSPYTIISPNVTQALQYIHRQFHNDFLAIGQSWFAYAEPGRLSLSDYFFQQALKISEPGATNAIEYLAFTRGFFSNFKDFALAGNLWPQALVHQAIIDEKTVIDLTHVVASITQMSDDVEHERATPSEGLTKEIDHNRALAFQRWDLGHYVHARYVLIGSLALIDRREDLTRFTSFVAPTRPLKKGITLCIHGGPEKLPVLTEVLRRWTGPTVVVLYRYNNGSQVGSVPDLDVFKKRFKDRLRVVTMEGDAMEYPVNILRNMALTNVDTELAFNLDADLVPSEGVYEYLMGHYADLTSDPHVCITMPTYRDIAPPSSATVPPRHKDELLAALDAGSVVPMDDWERPHHAVAEHSYWLTATEDYYVSYQFMYEPYCVVAMRNLPFFDNRFVYYGFDKVQHAYHMFRLGYKFKILASHFLVHKNHEPSDWTAVRESGLVDWQSEWFKQLMDYYLTNQVL